MALLPRPAGCMPLSDKHCRSKLCMLLDPQLLPSQDVPMQAIADRHAAIKQLLESVQHTDQLRKCLRQVHPLPR